MNATILDAMTDQYNSLTRSGKKLANYIFANTQDTQYMSITSLAENSGVSEATITRFCKVLGLTGYNDLKLELAKADHANHLSSDVLAGNAVILEDEDLDTMCRKLRDSSLLALTDTLDQLEEDVFNHAVSLLWNAQNVYCFGQGGSNVTAKEAWACFSTVTPKFIHIEDSHLQAMTSTMLTSRDAVLFFSYSASTRDMYDVFDLCKKNQTPIILITHFRNSRAASMADATLICGYNESPLHSGSIAAKMGQLFLIDCLFHAYCKKSSEECSASRALTSQAVAKKLL